MPNLVIPKPYQAGLGKIKALSPESLQRLAERLAAVPVTTETNQQVAFLAKGLPDIPRDDIEQIVRTITSLHQVRAHLEVPAERFLNDVIDAMKASGDPVLRKEEASSLREGLDRLLAIETLATYAKAQVLEREHAFLFHDARILTDLRPVFGATTTGAPTGMIVAHMLKIVYHKGLGDHNELYVAIDADDLRKLKKIIERAEEKERSLRTLLEQKDIRAFD